MDECNKTAGVWNLHSYCSSEIWNITYAVLQRAHCNFDGSKQSRIVVTGFRNALSRGAQLGSSNLPCIGAIEEESSPSIFSLLLVPSMSSIEMMH